MKTTKTMWVMLVTLLAATSCSETETEIDPEPGSGGQVSLGITPNLKVEAGTKAATKSMVNGDAITYDKALYSTTAPGLGVVVTNSDATGWYVPDGADIHHVWYMGDEKGKGWISITEKGSTFLETKEAPYYLTETIGKVYAYYPYDKTNSFTSIGNESDLKIPVKVLAAGSIDATTNNAKKYWKSSGGGGGTWTSRLAVNDVKLSETTEKDYLYFFASEGRYVNNGRAKGQPLFDPEGGPTNNETKNPGYLINLDMNHGLAMVSFRVYDGGHLSDDDVAFKQFVIQNHGESDVLKTGDGKMALSNGAITENATSGSVMRTISNYTLMRQIEEGDQSEKAFIANGSQVTGQVVSRSVSCLVYPVEFGDDQIDVVITLQEKSKSTVDYTVTLPGYDWTAGTNCVYTFSAGRNKLTLVDVTVQEWQDDDQEEIPL
ncbi:fimbrillin family protein [uncultured Parabacteroides sp.]|uniref:fimbrillin family protein n=1 Tax=uncultured Parabacteroides sp. TaxID=512312 RepID=UPI00259BEB01|nr:fimbrillin family protein [uncultured Parabacteroides sp.]